jgi:hypothetical protein
MSTNVLRTSARRVSCWRGDQQSGQYDHAKHKWHPALRYRHLSLPQSPSASRSTVGAFDNPEVALIRALGQRCALEFCSAQLRTRNRKRFERRGYSL